MWYVVSAIAIIVVFGLAYYAGQLLWQVKQKTLIEQAQKQKRLDYVTSSILHIGRAMQADQCEFSEGVLRVWVLLEHFNSEQNTPKQYSDIYPGFAKLYEVIKDMPTHDARKKLGKQERHKLDLERWKAEKEFEQEIRQDVDSIVEQFS